jgi:hypothetical protein
LNCARRFRETIPIGCKTKAGYIKLIQEDFVRQTHQLVLCSTPELLQQLSVPPPASDFTPRLLLICQLIHNRYGSIVASQLLCSPARWNPSPVTEDGTPQPGWLQTPITQLRSRLLKAGTETIRECCDLYATPDRAPKLKTERYDLIIGRFRARSLNLLSLSNVDFAKEHIALLPWTLSDPSSPRTQLLEVLLTEEFGEEISEQLISLPSSEITKERNKRSRRRLSCGARKLCPILAPSRPEECCIRVPGCLLQGYPVDDILHLLYLFQTTARRPNARYHSEHR